MEQTIVQVGQKPTREWGAGGGLGGRGSTAWRAGSKKCFLADSN